MNNYSGCELKNCDVKLSLTNSNYNLTLQKQTLNRAVIFLQTLKTDKSLKKGAIIGAGEALTPYPPGNYVLLNNKNCVEPKYRFYF